MTALRTLVIPFRTCATCSSTTQQQNLAVGDINMDKAVQGGVSLHVRDTSPKTIIYELKTI